MAAAAILKNKKWPYLGRGLTDVDEIWHADAVRPSSSVVQLDKNEGFYPTAQHFMLLQFIMLFSFLCDFHGTQLFSACGAIPVSIEWHIPWS